MTFQKGNKISVGKKNAFKHGNSPYSNYHIMTKVRIELLKKTKGKCEACGERGREIHHIDGSNSNHNIENLMLLCHRCHLFLHVKFDNEEKRVKLHSKYVRIYGMSLKEIGMKFGVSAQAVYLWIKSPEKEKWLREKLGLSE